MENQSVESPLNRQILKMDQCMEALLLGRVEVRQRRPPLVVVQKHLVCQCAEVCEDVRSQD